MSSSCFLLVLSTGLHAFMLLRPVRLTPDRTRSTNTVSQHQKHVPFFFSQWTRALLHTRLQSRSLTTVTAHLVEYPVNANAPCRTSEGMTWRLRCSLGSGNDVTRNRRWDVDMAISHVYVPEVHTARRGSEPKRQHGSRHSRFWESGSKGRRWSGSPKEGGGRTSFARGSRPTHGYPGWFWYYFSR